MSAVKLSRDLHEDVYFVCLGALANLCSCMQGEHLSEAARKLADHYKREAELLSQKAQVSHAAKLEAEVQSLRQQVNELEGRRLEAEEQVLQPVCSVIGLPSYALRMQAH